MKPRTRNKPTNEEMAERVEYMQTLLAKDMRDGDLKRAFREMYGNLDHATILEYKARARAKNLEAMKRPKNEWVAESIEVYRDIMADPTVKPIDKIKARERIDKLLGLDAPQRTEHTGADGGPIQIESLIDAAELTDVDISRALGEYKATNGAIDGVR